MSVLINECADYQIGAEKKLKLFPQKKQFSKKSDNSKDDILNKAKARMDSVFLTEKDLKFTDTLKVEREAKLISDPPKAEKPSKWTGRPNSDKESKLGDAAKPPEAPKCEKSKLPDLLKIEKELRQDLKKLQKQADEKEAKLNADLKRAKGDQNADLKRAKGDQRAAKGSEPKGPLSDYRIRSEDAKGRSFAQNNGRKYGLGDRPKSTLKETDSRDSKSPRKSDEVAAQPEGQGLPKKAEPGASPPLGVEKSKQNKPVQNETDEKVTLKKVIDKKTGKIIETGSSGGKTKAANGKVADSNAAKTGAKKTPKYVDTGLNRLRKKKKKEQVEPIIEKPEPAVQESEPAVQESEPVVQESEQKKNKKSTNLKPFSFDVRAQEFIKKKQMLAKMAEERKYEMKKWARSPVVLKKKPFVVRLNKRYIIPDLKIKLQTEERMKKRPKFELIVEQKQKSQKEKQLVKHMAEVKELRKTQIHSPIPIPEIVMRLMEEARKSRSDVSAMMSDSDDDSFSDSEYNDVYEYNPDAELPKKSDEAELVTSDEKTNENEDFNKNNLGSEKISSDSSSGEEENGTEKLSKDKIKKNEDGKLTSAERKSKVSKIDNKRHGDENQSNDAHISAEPTIKLSTYNLLLSAFTKKYSS